MRELFWFHEGSTPLLINVPHDGTHVPRDIAQRMTPEALALPDTDWHVSLLYSFAAELGAGLMQATHSRYVVDLNRDPSGRALYPGADNTGICPLYTFDRAPLYQEGAAPDEAELAARVETYWRPYHARLASAIEAVRRRHGVAVLFDAHSIRSQVPRFFAGELPVFNLGTAGGSSTNPELARRVFTGLEQSGYGAVRDGRFTGGFITRHYGRPEAGVHALQLELARRAYMEEDAPYAYLPERAERLKPVLRAALETIIAWATTRATP